MWGTTRLIGLRRPRIDVFTRRIGTCTCLVRNGKLTCTRYSLKSQFLMMISHPLSSLSFSSSTLPSPKNTKLSHPSLSLHAMIKSSHRVQHSPSTAYTEYIIHRVQHTLSTAYTAYCIIPRSTVSHSQPFSSLCRTCCTQFCTFPQLQVNQ